MLSDNSLSSSANVTTASAGTGRLVMWMLAFAVFYPWRCITVVFLNLLLMVLSLVILTGTGLNFDLLRHAANSAEPGPRWPMGWATPAGWTPVKTLLMLNLAILALALIRAFLRYLTVLAQGYLVQRMLTRLRTQVYDKLQRLSFRFFDANETGTLINRATSDVSSIPLFIDQAVVPVVTLAALVIVSFVYMWHISPRLTGVSMIGTPVLAGASIIYSRVVRSAYNETRRRYDRMILRLTENVQAQHAVKGFALERHEIARFAEANESLRAQQRWLFLRTSLYSASIVLTTQLNLMLVLMVGGWMVIRSQGMARPLLTLGDLIVFAALVQQLSTQITTIANVANTLQSSLTAAQRVREVIRTPVEIKSRSGSLSMPPGGANVVFDNVRFAYGAGEPVLHDISFEVKSGQCVAILGATGAGKSTLLSLLPRFYDPTQGRILINGIDVRELNLADLRRHIGLVFQESFLFSNTLAFNIAFGEPNATPEKIERAAHIAAADEFINQLPQKYQTLVGEHGTGLSGGQRQRVAIARAVLTEPSILILDDATAAIDAETEHEILGAMESAMKGRTTFVIAHRLSTLRRADFIVVLENGRIVETGTHSELMKRSGYYSKVAVLQVADPDSRFIIQARRWAAGEVPTLLPDSANGAPA